MVHPGVPQRSFVRLPDADWPDRGRSCFQLLPQLNCEPVPVRVFFGAVNFRAMHSNVITQFESAWVHPLWLSSYTVWFVSKRAQNLHGSVQLFLKFKIMLAWRHSKLPRYRYQKHYTWCWVIVIVIVKCVNKKTIPTNNIKVFPILFWERNGCECPVLKAVTFLLM